MKNNIIWDNIYKNYKYSKLPWYGLPFLRHLNKFLKTIDKSDNLVITGCGVGDTVNKIYNKGFRNILGIDLSSEAILIAKNRYPYINFKRIGTEDLDKEIGMKKVIVIDWLNLHQINPDLFRKYLDSLNNISKSIFLAYFFDIKRPLLQKSIITGKYIYNYQPREVINCLNKMKLINESEHITKINKKFNKRNLDFNTITQIYKKR